MPNQRTMSPISIVFRTPSNPNFTWFDTFKSITDEELDEFAIHCRNATAAIFTELSDRRNPWKDRTLENYQDMLLKNAHQINQGELNSEHEVYLDNLHTYLAGPGDARKDVKVATQFLWLLSRITDWSYALLLLCSLGKHRLQKMDEDRRVKLIRYIIQDRDSLFCPVLKDRAIQCQLHQIRMNHLLRIEYSLRCFRYQDRPSTHKRLQEAEETRKHRWHYPSKRTTKRSYGNSSHPKGH